MKSVLCNNHNVVNTKQAYAKVEFVPQNKYLFSIIC